MSTTRMSRGLAFAPDREMAMLAEMAARGKRLTGFGALGHGWTFTDAPREQAVFDLAYEPNPPAGYFDIFTAAGWTPVLSAGHLHIFKAAPGTPPVHTATDSRREELLRQRDRYARWSAVTIAFLAVVALLLTAGTWGPAVEAGLLAVALVPVVYTLLPLAGHLTHLRRLDRQAVPQHGSPTS